MRIFFSTALSLALSVSLVAAAPVTAKESAKITKNEAEHIALRRHSGARVTSARLETIGSQLVWSIQMASHNGKHVSHVSVDAMSGQIVQKK
jgi:uncharacterized membrane protein YkoI